MEGNIEAVRAILEKHDQSHLLKFEKELSSEEREALLEEIQSIDFGRLKVSFDESQHLATANTEKKDARLSPLSPEICGSTLKDQELVPSWEKGGLKVIGEGKVCVFVCGVERERVC